MTGLIDVTPSALRDHPLPALAGARDKQDRGQVLVIAGGRRVPGAPILTGTAALRAGAGKLQLATTPDSTVALGLAAPEAGLICTAATPAGEFAPEPSADLREAAERADAMVIGPGMSDEGAAAALASALIAIGPSAAVVIDAAALAGLRLRVKPGDAARGMVLSPHAGEMSKLIRRSKEAVEADPLGAAQAASEATGATVIMKGAETFIVSPDGSAWRHSGGAIGLATSGSGDVLAGIVAGLLARGASPPIAAIWAVYTHAEAGRILAQRVGPVGFLARELLAEIPRVLAAV